MGLTITCFLLRLIIEYDMLLALPILQPHHQLITVCLVVDIVCLRGTENTTAHHVASAAFKVGKRIQTAIVLGFRILVSGSS